ncbi:tRNA (adenine-N1)-methyltransferase [Mailhella massiliensis]|uniref:tRNA (adenine-N1)-methyltransferase n=1 Tax=Mailhella massiliensis TaxID=1903261 RepID=UPI0023551A62|nr:tRNA (adenine-N1)-methyltransferase [Mailhella massiliensis]
MPQYGDLVILASPRGKRHIYRIEQGQDLHTQDGVMRACDVVEAEFGTEVRTAKGVPFRLQKPQLHDLVMGIKRQTQIMYPKDMGLICFKLGVGNGRTILEVGSGSGGFTLALSWFSGPEGHVHSFEAREEFHKLAKRNLEWAGVGKNVTLHLRDIANGFGVDAPDCLNGKKGDALFLDVRTPWEYLDAAREALVPGAPIAFLLPTVEQVSQLITALEIGPFEETEVCEVLVRPWKVVPGRLRPADRMSAHTAFLVFTRIQERSADWDALIPLGTRERKQEAARQARLAAARGEDPESVEYDV